MSSWCQGDAVLPLRPAPGPDYDDVGNKYDNDTSTDEKQLHNQRYHAACPSENTDGQ